MVDWSASSRPVTGRDSIWIAVHDGTREVALVNPPTRAAAAAVLDGVIADRPAERLLVGVDFPLGHPSGTASALGLEGDAWRATWTLLDDLIRDDECNRNNRFEVAAELNRRIGAPAGPFWGCPAAHVCDTLGMRKPADRVLGEYRWCERALRARAFRPSSVWQLAGAGSVGSQALVGIPIVARLLARHGSRLAVWPLTTGPRLRAPIAFPAVVVAEVWPTVFGYDPSLHAVRDAAQVRRVVSELARHDASGALASWFELPDADSIDAGTAEEAAILGPPHNYSS